MRTVHRVDWNGVWQIVHGKVCSLRQKYICFAPLTQICPLPTINHERVKGLLDLSSYGLVNEHAKTRFLKLEGN